MNQVQLRGSKLKFTRNIFIINRSEEKKFDRIMEKSGMAPSMIAGVEGNSSFMDGTSSLFPTEGNKETNEVIDEYVDDDDPGFELYEVYEEYFESSCKELATRFGFPARSIKPEPKGNSSRFRILVPEKKKGEEDKKSKKERKPEKQDDDEIDVSTESKRSKRPPKGGEGGEEDSSILDHKEKLKNPDRKELIKDDHKGGLTKTASEGNIRGNSSTANLDEIIKKVDKNLYI